MPERSDVPAVEITLPTREIPTRRSTRQQFEQQRFLFQAGVVAFYESEDLANFGDGRATEVRQHRSAVWFVQQAAVGETLKAGRKVGGQVKTRPFAEAGAKTSELAQSHRIIVREVKQREVWRGDARQPVNKPC